MAATRHENHDDMIADREIVHARADFNHDPRRFVAERHRHGTRPAAIDDREVGMARPRRFDLDQRFAKSGAMQFDLLNLERTALSLGRGKPDLPEDGGADPHLLGLLPGRFVLAALDLSEKVH